MRVIVTCGFGILALITAHAAEKTVLRAASDLPPSQFELSSPPGKAFLLDDFVTRTVPLLKAEAERVRAKYQIADNALENRLRAGLAAIALLQKRPGEAAALVLESRRAATKPQQRAIGMFFYDVLASSPELGGQAGCAAGAAHITSLLARSASAEVRDDALGRLLEVEIASPRAFAGAAEAELDPGAVKRGGITLLEGLTLATYRVMATMLPPCRTEYSAAIRAWAADPKTQPDNIWVAREPDPALLTEAKPVTVAVWDHGYDPTLFSGQLAVDPGGANSNGADKGSRIEMNWNGPTYGYRLEPIAAPLPPPSLELATQLAFQMALVKGNADLHYGYRTSEAALFATRLREAEQADQTLDALLWEEMRTRGHGTEVASEIADGAPFVRLYNVAAIPWGYDPRPVPMDEAQIARWVRAIDSIGPRIRAAGVRIVNISWSITADEIAQGLLSTGIEGDQKRAVARGKAMYAQADAALRRLLRESPDILFVASAGNSNQTDDIYAASPQSIVSPNLVVVGASGTNGRPTSFTTYGKTVSIFAWGQGVPVRTPGGMKTRSSGTSMAAPLVARAAASMLAVNAQLKPARIIEGLTTTATVGENGLKLLHAAAAIRWAALPSTRKSSAN